MGAPKLAHSEPLLSKLELAPLDTRRKQHSMDIIRKVMNGTAHPTLLQYFELTEESELTCDLKPHTAMGKKTFQIRAVTLYNATSLVQQKS